MPLKAATITPLTAATTLRLGNDTSIADTKASPHMQPCQKVAPHFKTYAYPSYHQKQSIS